MRDAEESTCNAHDDNDFGERPGRAGLTSETT
jgi:hypothetical protein